MQFLKSSNKNGHLTNVGDAHPEQRHQCGRSKSDKERPNFHILVGWRKGGDGDDDNDSDVYRGAISVPVFFKSSATENLGCFAQRLKEHLVTVQNV